MADRGRGGPRQPARPAAVSGPGALSARTDGGAGSAKQPIRVATGGAYGERQAAVEQQQAAPMAAAGGAGGTPAPVQGQVASPPGGGGGVFGATQHPEQPMGGAGGVNQMAQNPQQVLRYVYSKFPHPAIARLLDYSTGNERATGTG